MKCHIRIANTNTPKPCIARGFAYILSLEVPPVGALNLDVVLQHGPAATTIAPGTDPIPTSTVRDNVVGVLFHESGRERTVCKETANCNPRVCAGFLVVILPCFRIARTQWLRVTGRLCSWNEYPLLLLLLTLFAHFWSV
jgi:hypothetical protein